MRSCDVMESGVGHDQWLADSCSSKTGPTVSCMCHTVTTQQKLVCWRTKYTEKQLIRFHSLSRCVMTHSCCVVKERKSVSMRVCGDPQGVSGSFKIPVDVTSAWCISDDVISYCMPSEWTWPWSGCDSDLSLSSQQPSGMVGSSETLRRLCRFCAVRRDTIHCSFLWLGLLHSGEA